MSVDGLRTLDARFEDFDDHRSMVVRWHPDGELKAHALFIPAFGDEMNQTRRMVKLAAEALAQRGVTSTVFDLLGTGDSSADFSEATIERWLSDCRSMVERLHRESSVPLMLIGCRLGVALAVRLTQQLPQRAEALIGWAPLLQGRAQLSGMLRAAAIARSHRPDVNALPDAKARWTSGCIAVLGGYTVSPSLAEQLKALDSTGAPQVARATLIDVRLAVDSEPPVPSHAIRERAAAWTESGVPTDAVAVPGAGFWNVSDLVDVPELVGATLAAMKIRE